MKKLIGFTDLHKHKEEYVNIKGLCNLLGVEKRTVSTWREEGIISYSKVLGKIYFKVQDIIDMLEKHKVVKKCEQPQVSNNEVALLDYYIIYIRSRHLSVDFDNFMKNYIKQ